MKPVIFGLAGPTLSDDERALFRECEPAGYILFRRNIVDKAQVRALTDELRAIDGRSDLAILIDQEGGKVSRMQPPVWPAFPSGNVFNRLYEKAPISALEAARTNAKAIALVVHQVGVDVDCLPLLDVCQNGTHPAIADRALGSEPMRVAALGRVILEGLRDGGVVGVVKHMPGQGRAVVDSHHDLPFVDASEAELAVDLEPFSSLNHAPMGMTGHIIFAAWDAERCATLSPVIIGDIIRKRIGFDGFLMSDDLDMKALRGEVSDHAVACVEAGCDVALNCWGRFDEMVAIAEKLPEITVRGRERLNAAMATVADVKPDYAELEDLIARRDALLALA